MGFFFFSDMDLCGESHSFLRRNGNGETSGEAKSASTSAASEFSTSEVRDEVVESKVELMAAVEEIGKQFSQALKQQAEETAKMIADIKSNEVKRTQGARRASGVFAGQGDGVNVTSFTTVPEFGSESSIENFHYTPCVCHP